MPSLPLHVVQISFFFDAARRLPEELLEAWPTLVDVAEAAALACGRVSVVQACAHSAHFARNGVHYYFRPFGEGSGSGSSAEALQGLLEELAPDVLHVHGLGFLRDTRSLRAICPRIPIILQDHANRPPRIWRRPSWRRALSVAAGICFCARAQAHPFVTLGLIPPATRVYEVPESTCRFAPGDRREARRLEHIAGDPALLWVGHLDHNKDPLTVLSGIGEAVEALPGLQLYCCYATAPLLEAVQARIAADSRLQSRVHLLGRVAHDRIERLMRAADLFVLGSHREGSGYSVIEALACGLLPVVTDIPSYRSLTAGGTVGALWACGAASDLTRALRLAAERVGAQTRAAVRAHFERELSFAAVGRKLAAMYADVLASARGIEVRGPAGRKAASGTV